MAGSSFSRIPWLSARKRFPRRILSFFLLASLHTASAQWSWDPTVSTPICTYSSSQYLPKIIGDSAGGAIISWIDTRQRCRIYGQRISRNGFSLWTDNGVAFCDSAFPVHPQNTSDFNRGAFITWSKILDPLNPAFSWYQNMAQHIDSSGNPRWSQGGVPCGPSTWTSMPGVLAAEKSGEIFFSMRDNQKLLLFRIDKIGSHVWGANGICIDSIAFNDPVALATDGKGGVYIVYEKYTIGLVGLGTYCQRISGAGAMLWCDSIQYTPTRHRIGSVFMTRSGKDGIICAKNLDTGGVSKTDIYAQRIDSSGSKLWGPNGLVVVSDTGDQICTSIAEDGNGGVIVAWYGRSKIPGRNDHDIFMQIVDRNGNLKFPQGGVAVCTAPRDQLRPIVVTDRQGGAIVCWEDHRDSAITGIDIYAQRVSATGQIGWNWAPNGIKVCTAPYNQINRDMTSDIDSGAIVVWDDGRNTQNQSPDIYAAKISKWGLLVPVTFQYVNGCLTDSRTTVTWRTADELNNVGFIVERAWKSGTGAIAAWESRGYVPGHGTSNAMHEYRFEESIADIIDKADAVIYRLKQVDADGSFEYSPSIEIAITGAAEDMQISVYPNPAIDRTAARFYASQPVEGTLTLYDVMGREIGRICERTFEKGFHAIPVSVESLAPGVYFLRLQTGGNVRSARIVVRK